MLFFRQREQHHPRGASSTTGLWALALSLSSTRAMATRSLGDLAFLLGSFASWCVHPPSSFFGWWCLLPPSPLLRCCLGGAGLVLLSPRVWCCLLVGPSGCCCSLHLLLLGAACFLPLPVGGAVLPFSFCWVVEKVVLKNVVQGIMTSEFCRLTGLCSVPLGRSK